MKSPQGFTLIEMVLSMACITIIAGMSIPAYNSFQIKNDLDTAATSLATSLRRAQVLAQSGSGDSMWGVYTATGSILIYKGSSYVARDTSKDETTTISPAIIISGLKEVSFGKMWGLPTTIGTTTLTSLSNDIRAITINQKGMVDY
jgi:prepilin-type N-terminal cleavage/methylation domain-containing protein